MPFTTKSAEKHNKSLKTAKQKRQWVSVANQQLAACIKKGGTDESCAPKAIRIANGVVKKAMEQSMDDEIKNLPDGDFLVLAEGTRHLPVRIQGEPNRKLANMAWAHLFADDQADEYKGPGKAAAKSSIRALYRETGWDTPKVEEGVFYDPEGVIAEYRDSAYPSYYTDDEKARRVPWGVVTFDDLDKAQEAAELADRLSIRVDQFQTMFWRIWNSVDYGPSGPSIEEATVAWGDLFKEFITVFEVEADITVTQETGESRVIEVDFSESAVMSNAVIIEDNLAESSADPDRSHLSMNIEMIQPGWGNKKDNHWYPGPVLRRDVPHVFKGIKMYTTNHREGERSERTEVAEIEEIVDFSASGAPIAKVIVFDPLFAEKTRNRARAGKLASLECSILASGTIRKGMVDGREANIVETITSAKAVDFVTSAGAGGHATSLNESELAEFSETGDEIMSEKPEKDALQETPVEEKKQETTEATFSEKETDASKQEQKEQEKQKEQEQEQEVTFLSEAEISTCLNSCNLPSPSKVRLAQVSYETVDALAEAITQETEYVKVLTASGKPKSSAASASKKAPPTKTLEEINAAKDAVNEKWIGARPALKKS